LFNGKEIAGSAIDSVRAQTFRDFQLILIDDGSDDGTADWAGEYCPEAVLIRLPTNSGPAAARNAGIRCSLGRLIAFLDQDDIWAPKFLAVHEAVLERHPRAVFSACGCRVELPDGRQSVHTVMLKKPYRDFQEQMLFTSAIKSMSLIVVRREALFAIGLLDERLRVAHDRAMYLALIERGELATSDAILVRKRIQWNSAHRQWQLWADDLEVVLRGFFGDPTHRPWRHLRGDAIAASQLRVAEVAEEWRASRWLILRLRLRAFSYSPRRTLQAIARSRRQERGT
jgi:glycosyltransferase involved in cell wall biosynthesis